MPENTKYLVVAPRIGLNSFLTIRDTTMGFVIAGGAFVRSNQPISFDHIGGLINEDQIVPGGEASAGLSVEGHYPEKDGIHACLYAAEAIPARGAFDDARIEHLTAGPHSPGGKNSNGHGGAV